MDRKARLILTAGLTIFGGALLALLFTGHTEIMPSADSTETISIWSVLIPVPAAMVLIRVSPPRASSLAIEQKPTPLVY